MTLRATGSRGESARMREFHLKRILVPTDLSQSSIIALRYARLFAERFSAGLSIFHVDPLPVLNDSIWVAESPDHFAKLENDIRAWADPALNGIPYTVAAIEGDPVRDIVRRAGDDRDDLIVMATHGLRGWRRAILGSVTESVVHRGECPVLSVSRPQESQPDFTPAITKILCPINFTDVSRDALEYASRLAGAFDCRLVIVHVVDDQDAIREVVAEEDVRSWIAPAVQNRCSYREIMLRGGAAERVLDCAEDIRADLVVIGAQHKLFRDETTVGATTERLVRFARMPVLAIPRRLVEDRERLFVEQRNVLTHPHE